jgi:hypothetical protein
MGVAKFLNDIVYKKSLESSAQTIEVFKQQYSLSDDEYTLLMKGKNGKVLGLQYQIQRIGLTKDWPSKIRATLGEREALS